MNQNATATSPITALVALTHGERGEFAAAIDRAILHGEPISLADVSGVVTALRNELSRALEVAMNELSTTDHELLHRLSACSTGVRGLEGWLSR